MSWQKAGHNNRLFSVKYKQDEHNIIVSGGWDMNVIYYIINSKINRLIYGIEEQVML